MNNLKLNDPELYNFIELEKNRQKQGIELIPSENYASPAVLEALGSVLNNKYAEGYPGKRYYGGNIHIDAVEQLAISRAQKLFKTDYLVNVQPYSGSPANIAVYTALLNFNDTLMGMSLNQGGHLSHGHKVNFSGRNYNIVQYGVNPETEIIDYDEVSKVAKETKPKLIICGFTAYPRKIDFKRFSEIAKSVNAYLMADISHIAGLIACNLHESPFGYADVITTTTHKTLRGPRSAIIFSKNVDIAQKIDRAVFPGLQGGPHVHQIAAVATCLFEAAQPSFKNYSMQVIANAKAIANALSKNGFRLVSGGTDNHLLLLDLKNKDISGKEAEDKLDSVGITVNKNTIPFDTRKPMDPSGIRLGTPAVTTRGMTESDMQIIADFINDALNTDNLKELQIIKNRVRDFSLKYPIWGY